jgi:hypothetical protein
LLIVVSPRAPLRRKRGSGGGALLGNGFPQDAQRAVATVAATGRDLQLVTQCLHGTHPPTRRFTNIPVGYGIADAYVHDDPSEISLMPSANENGYQFISRSPYCQILRSRYIFNRKINGFNDRPNWR